MELINNINTVRHLDEYDLDNVLFQLSVAEKFIATHITHYGLKAWGYCQKAQRVIADELNVSLRTVERAISKLKKSGLLEVVRCGRNAAKIIVSPELISFYNKWRFNGGSKRSIPYIEKEKDPDPPIKPKLSTGGGLVKNLIGSVSGFFNQSKDSKMADKNISREVFQQIIKHFPKSERKQVVEVLYHIEESCAFKIRLIEVVESSRLSMKKSNKTINNIGAFINFKHKELKKGDQEAMMQKDESKMYGFDKQELMKQARPGESFYNTAKRLQGDDDEDLSEIYNPWVGSQKNAVIEHTESKEHVIKTKRMLDSRQKLYSENAITPDKDYFQKLRNLAKGRQ